MVLGTWPRSQGGCAEVMYAFAHDPSFKVLPRSLALANASKRAKDEVRSLPLRFACKLARFLQRVRTDQPTHANQLSEPNDSPCDSANEGLPIPNELGPI
jgi:hypothetical protein